MVNSDGGMVIGESGVRMALPFCGRGPIPPGPGRRDRFMLALDKRTLTTLFGHPCQVGHTVIHFAVSEQALHRQEPA
jgi:hypothetical protein